VPDPSVSALNHRARAFGAGLLHALLLGLSFPPVGWWFLAFIAPLPLFWVAKNPGRSVVGAGFWAMIGVAPFWVWSHAWVSSISVAGVYPLVVYLSLHTWVFVVAGHRALRGPIPGAFVLAIVWCGIEFFRGAIGWSGYPWYMLGHPMIDSANAALAWPAAVGGVTLVSMLVALPPAWLATRRAGDGHGDREGGRATAIAIGTLCVVWVAWAILRPTAAESDIQPFRVGVVQTNVPQDNRIDWSTAQRLDDWLTMRAQTERVAASDPAPDVIVWPEGLVPGWTLDPVALDLERSRAIVWHVRPESEAQARRLAAYPSRTPATLVVDEILEMQRSLGVPMLLGAVAYDNLRIVNGDTGLVYENDALYNSAFLVQNGRVGDVWYDKVHLTPFGEIMPYISAWPWLEESLLSFGAQGMAFVLDPARSVKTIPLFLPGDRSVEMATPICFEATMPGVCRRLANVAHRTGRPVVLINMTNDGWFAGSDRGRGMHAHAARWRCVELGVPMVRVANTGVSGSIDRFGRVMGSLPPREAGEAVFPVVPGVPSTVYARLGEWTGWGAMLGLVGLMWLGGGRNSRLGERSAEECGKG